MLELAYRLSERRCQARSVCECQLMLNRPAAERPCSFAPHIRHGDGIPPPQRVCSCSCKHSRSRLTGEACKWTHKLATPRFIAVITSLLFAQSHMEYWNINSCDWSNAIRTLWILFFIMMSVRGVPSKAPHNSIRLRFRSAICGFFQQCFVYFITVVVIITVIDASFPPQEYPPPPPI